VRGEKFTDADRRRLAEEIADDLEAGELHINNDLHERIVEACGWPRSHVATADSPTLVAGEQG
jgi:hypothetical protein